MGGGGEGEMSRPLGGWGESGGGLSLVMAAAAGDRSGGAGDSPADSENIYGHIRHLHVGSVMHTCTHTCT